VLFNWWPHANYSTWAKLRHMGLLLNFYGNSIVWSSRRSHMCPKGLCIGTGIGIPWAHAILMVPWGSHGVPHGPMHSRGPILILGRSAFGWVHLCTLRKSNTIGARADLHKGVQTSPAFPMAPKRKPNWLSFNGKRSNMRAAALQKKKMFAQDRPKLNTRM
jgi:hypothetical protein